MREDYRIVVLHRGFVVYGLWSREGDTVTIRNCQTIRRWGTTQGLGQLAMSGPTTSTVLDPQPDTSVHILAVIQSIKCEGEPWPRK